MADSAGQVLNVKTVQVSGKITLNGAEPKPGTGCTTTQNPTAVRARVLLSDASRGHNIEVRILCKDPGYAFSTPLFPGTYEVRVRGEGWPGQDLPSNSYRAVSRIVIP